ncbi:transmembrane protein 138-like isoform X1 [Vespa mandarinia]|uniref:transmembrane protein 138-like isoform X1 n=1 Tax=Vespa mandarinia TaxID=7446 RepID=UPI00161E4A90|nr:transmembrane protein 138-like isoform X1 [Vespa mandarinia]
MSILTARKYTTIIIGQYLILFFDICVNSFGSFARQHPINLLVLYVIQDFCLIVALIVLLVNFFSTYIFQAGLIQLLYIRFRMTLIVCILYLVLSIILHIWHITLHWSNPLTHNWTKGFHAIFAVHRIVSVFYYYFYKRAALKIADPKLYEGSSWVEKQLSLL